MSAPSSSASTGDAWPGRGIVVTAWVGNALFALTAIPLVLGADALEVTAIVTALLLFTVSMVVWVWALGLAAVRTTRGDDVAVGSLFLVQGTSPKVVRVHLYGALGVCLVITALTASADPFGVLVPMLPLGLVGLWGARHGEYPARDAPAPPVRGRQRRGAHGRDGE